MGQRRDVSTDLQALQLNSEWYQLCLDRREWFECFWSGIDEVASTRKMNRCAVNRQSQEDFLCECGRSFHQKGD